MNTLFPPTIAAEDLPKIPGLRYLPDHITNAEERRLVEEIDRLPWDTSWQRRRQPYGGGYGSKQSVPPVPGWGTELARRLLADGLTDRPFDHLLVNEYHPGQGIGLHADYEPFDRTVASLSLLSACVMDFRHPKTGRTEHLLLQPRSLLVLSDEARYAWQHGIAHRKRDSWHGVVLDRSRRLSVTFRAVKSQGASA